MINKIQELYPNQLLKVNSINEIPKNVYVVYILFFNDTPIVVGHGKKNRAKVIFDNIEEITSGHIKALFVRLYTLFGKGKFSRFIIKCESKDEAQLIERRLHNKIGGNNRFISDEIRTQIFKGLSKDSPSYLVLEIALRSSFDGLSDLRKWRKDNIISDTVWRDVAERLVLND